MIDDGEGVRVEVRALCSAGERTDDDARTLMGHIHRFLREIASHESCLDDALVLALDAAVVVH